MDVNACICLQCSKPFVGDGRQCTIDSDGDGFGDNELDCELDICRRVRNVEFIMTVIVHL